MSANNLLSAVHVLRLHFRQMPFAVDLKINAPKRKVSITRFACECDLLEFDFHQMALRRSARCLYLSDDNEFPIGLF
jgi:hypothetical protein